MGRIVAIGGGELDTTHKINQYLVEMAGKQNANVLFIGTASRDAEGYISAIQVEFESLGCVVSALRLVTETYTEAEIDDVLNQADIIYVGGGDTDFMMSIWKKYGLDQKLKQIYHQKQTILSGLSAGAICWFHCGHSDSSVFWKGDEVGYGWVNDLLDIYSYVFGPHYDERGENFDKMMQEKSVPAIALENNVALVEENGTIHYIASDDLHKAYLIQYADGVLDKQEQAIEVL